jgi:hypothetical protein
MTARGLTLRFYTRRQPRGRMRLPSVTNGA